MSLVVGCPRVEGDEEEDDIDDLENEFDINDDLEAMLSSRLNIGRGSQARITTPSEMDSASVVPEIPLLTYGQEVV